MAVFLADALLYVWTLTENAADNFWGFISLASVYTVSLLIAAGVVSVINK